MTPARPDRAHGIGHQTSFVHNRELPFLDDLSVRIDAPLELVWWWLLQRCAHQDSARNAALTRLLGSALGAGSDHSPKRGASIPGFSLGTLQPGCRLHLRGHHHFAEYELEFQLRANGDVTVLRASSRALFRGRRGALFKVLVVRSGLHGVVLGVTLKYVQRHAEAAWRPRP